MTRYLQIFTAVLAVTFLAGSASAQYSTPPVSAAEKETLYTTSIEKRATNILQELALADAARSARVHAAIIAQYRALRARDEAVDAMLKALSKDTPGLEANRTAIVRILSKPLHDQFLAKLAADLTPEQVEVVKDKMTYKKVKVTYDAYCAIIPNLADKEKARILEVLKEAREEAMDGGSAGEKSAIFQKYKDQINAYLTANGHDVAKAYKDWEAKQELANKAKDESAPPVTQPQ